MTISESDYSKTIFAQGLVCINTNNNQYCVVINGRKGSADDRSSLVLEFDGDSGFFIHTPPNRALKPTGKVVSFQHLANAMRQYVVDRRLKEGEYMLGTKEQRTEGMKRQSQELIDHAYDRGFKAGYDKAFATLNENWQLVTSEAEEKGRNEGWEAAKKIMRMDLVERTKIFAEIGRSTYSVYIDMSASEAIEKIREYEEKQKQKENAEIHIGDVIRKDDVEAVVTWCDGKDWNGFLLKGEDVGEVGQVYSCMSCNGWEKTGSHFQEIVEVLKKMKEGE